MQNSCIRKCNPSDRPSERFCGVIAAAYAWVGGWPNQISATGGPHGRFWASFRRSSGCGASIAYQPRVTIFVRTHLTAGGGGITVQAREPKPLELLSRAEPVNPRKIARRAFLAA